MGTVKYAEIFPDMAVMPVNYSQKLKFKTFEDALSTEYTYDAFIVPRKSSSRFRPKILAQSNGAIWISLDAYPLDNSIFKNYYCPPPEPKCSKVPFFSYDDFQNQEVQEIFQFEYPDPISPSDCVPFINITFDNVIINITGAGLIVKLEQGSNLFFRSGYQYREAIKTFSLQDYNPQSSSARTYFCHYGIINLLSSTLSTTYATINPILSVLLGILIIFALFQIRYVYGQDIQQLYYQDIERTTQYQSNQNFNSDTLDTVALENKVDRVSRFLVRDLDIDID